MALIATHASTFSTMACKAAGQNGAGIGREGWAFMGSEYSSGNCRSTGPDAARITPNRGFVPESFMACAGTRKISTPPPTLEMHHMKRLHGLDTLRAAAIVMVLAYHYKVVVTGVDTFGYLSSLGWTGVDLFFVLSGYLIGNQIIAQPGGFSVRQFYLRRLLRTLPNYLVVLALYLLVPALMEKETAPLWRFLTFTQNFSLRPGQTFTHSWSLCIEEQFYLILPAVVLLCARFKRGTTLGWLLLVAGMVGAVMMRYQAWHAHGREAIDAMDYYQHIYYSSLCRFDELLPGVAIAMLKNLHPQAYARITGKGNALLGAGLAGVAAMFTLYSGPEFSFLSTTVGYSLLALSFGLLVLSALSPDSLLHKARVPGAYPAGAVVLRRLPRAQAALQADGQAGRRQQPGRHRPDPGAQPVGRLAVLFRLVETPFMALRARLFQNKKMGSVPEPSPQIFVVNS